MLGRTLQMMGLGGFLASAAGFAYYQQTDIQRKFEILSAMGPFVRLADPELTHKLGIWSAKWGLFPKDTRPDPDVLRVHLWGKTFNNPLGLAAGFDKDAEAMEGMLGVGFGFVEVGSITPQPQPGNPKPRVFRIKDLKSIINRYGFNSIGAEAAALNLEAFKNKSSRDATVKTGLLGINLGKNKTTENAAADYCRGLQALGKYADFVVINISSPNTPGLRALQSRKQLEDLIKSVQNQRNKMEWGPSGPPPLVLKIAPDLAEVDKQDIATVALKFKLDGLIVGNTTVSRPPDVQKYPESKEAGGLSGPPLMELSTKVLADMYRLTRGRIPIIGCGGISDGEDAYKKIRAGASLVELYTALAYTGPVVVPHIKQQLADCLQRDGYKSLQEAVGADVELVNHKKGWRFPFIW